MNPLEKNVASLEMYKKMHDAGIDFGETAFVWCNHEKLGFVLETYQELIEYQKNCEPFTFYKAPTVTEMINKLPKTIITKEKKHYLVIGINKHNTFSAEYVSDDGYSIFSENKITPNGKDAKEALAKLCLWCKENDYV